MWRHGHCLQRYTFIPRLPFISFVSFFIVHRGNGHDAISNAPADLQYYNTAYWSSSSVVRYGEAGAHARESSDQLMDHPWATRTETGMLLVYSGDFQSSTRPDPTEQSLIDEKTTDNKYAFKHSHWSAWQWADCVVRNLTVWASNGCAHVLGLLWFYYYYIA